MSDTFNRIRAGLEDAIEYARGDTKDRRVHRIDVPAVNVRSIRHRTGLTQQEFSMKYGFAVASVCNWEQGRRQPDRSARLLLMVIDKHPEVVEEVIASA
jgi:putative transcriptional regulator